MGTIVPGGINMSLTNLCSYALMKDHTMRQIINDIYLLFLRIMNLVSFFLRTKILIYFCKKLRLYPPPPPPHHNTSYFTTQVPVWCSWTSHFEQVRKGQGETNSWHSHPHHPNYLLKELSEVNGKIFLRPTEWQQWMLTDRQTDRYRQEWTDTSR